MKSTGKTYLQCQCCGEVFTVNDKIDIEELYVKSYPCPRCDNRYALNVGESGDLDYYTYYNPVMDRRFY